MPKEVNLTIQYLTQWCSSALLTLQPTRASTPQTPQPTDVSIETPQPTDTSIETPQPTDVSIPQTPQPTDASIPETPQPTPFVSNNCIHSRNTMSSISLN